MPNWEEGQSDFRKLHHPNSESENWLFNKDKTSLSSWNIIQPGSQSPHLIGVFIKESCSKG